MKRPLDRPYLNGPVHGWYFRQHPTKGLQWWVHSEWCWKGPPIDFRRSCDVLLEWELTWAEAEC